MNCSNCGKVTELVHIAHTPKNREYQYCCFQCGYEEDTIIYNEKVTKKDNR